MPVALCSVLAGPPAEREGAPLARALRRRDAQVLDALVEQHGTRLLRYLIHLVGQRPAAEDLFQETWLRVMERGHQYDGGRPFAGWLFGIARHLALDHLRRRQPVSLDEIDSPDEHPGGVFADDGTPSPFDQVAARERREDTDAMVRALPAGFREVLYLRFTEEMRLGEIAQVTGLPVPTVKSRLYRALQRLQERLGDHHE